MTITFSRRLAIILGILTPLAETVRRWRQLGQLSLLPAWLDDYIIGALLLYGAWRTGKDIRSGRPFLVAAWGVTCGMAYSSFFSQLARLNEPDPAPIPRRATDERTENIIAPPEVKEVDSDIFASAQIENKTEPVEASTEDELSDKRSWL